MKHIQGTQSRPVHGRNHHAAVFRLNFLKGIDFFSTSEKYYVVYQNVDQLTESNQVFLNGYAVGRVSNIQIQQKKGSGGSGVGHQSRKLF
jgi:hypothetical protein